MGVVVKPNTFTASTTILASEVNANFDTLYTLVNGNIEAANIASGAVGESELASSAVTNAKVSSTAAIALSKLAALTASRAVVSDGSGVISASAVTATELGYVSGVTSAIQTQLDAKAEDAADAGAVADGGQATTAYAGFVPNTADATNAEILPAGWSTSRSSGRVTVTHNLGRSDLVIAVGASNRGGFIVAEDYSGRTVNEFAIACQSDDGTTDTAGGFHFVVFAA